MTADDLREYLIATLVRAKGGNRRRWRIAVGDVRLYDLATHPHCNWAISPSGSILEISAIERLIDDVRATHPILTR